MSKLSGEELLNMITDIVIAQPRTNACFDMIQAKKKQIEPGDIENEIMQEKGLRYNEKLLIIYECLFFFTNERQARNAVKRQLLKKVIEK